MAYEILTESYGRRLPKITAEADSTDDLATLGTNYAEGSTCVIGDKTYSLDKVQGWIEAGSGGGGGVFWVTFTWEGDPGSQVLRADKTIEEIYAAAQSGKMIQGREVNIGQGEIEDVLLKAVYFICTEVSYHSADFQLTEYSHDQSDTQALSTAYRINEDNTVSVTLWAWTVEDDS